MASLLVRDRLEAVMNFRDSAPKVRPHASPGPRRRRGLAEDGGRASTRPGYRVRRTEALKGRLKLGARKCLALTGLTREIRCTQGVALGWYVDGPLARRTRRQSVLNPGACHALLTPEASWKLAGGEAKR